MTGIGYTFKVVLRYILEFMCNIYMWVFYLLFHARFYEIIKRAFGCIKYAHYFLNAMPKILFKPHKINEFINIFSTFCNSPD